MPPINEIDAITAVDNALSQIQEPLARDRVLRWAWDKYSSKPTPSPELSGKVDDNPAPKKKGKITKKAKPAAKASMAVLKDLNLRPKGETPFKDFAEEKNPSTNQEKSTVAIYYLRNKLGLDNVSASHVFTCYKEATWRTPADMYRALPTIAHAKGWIDTRDMNNIKVTPPGENLVEHDLPRKAKTEE